MRVLLIEDDQKFSDALQLHLKAEGFNVYATNCGDEGLDLGKLYDYDIIVLDSCLRDTSGRDTSGLDVLKSLRAANIATPVLILAGNVDPVTAAHYLNAGADDYVVKSCDQSELVARIRAIIRRSKGHGASIIAVGNVQIDLGKRVATAQGERVNLTCKEYGVLELLLLHKGETVTRQMFLDNLYDGENEPDGKVFEVFISKLRKKLEGDNGREHHITTVRGRGYSMSDPEPEDTVASVTPEEIACLLSSEA
tara:strand:+ start:2454 stop:3209 length:756 start_codon:yes stop_codon:yes gene_type:complete